MTTHSPSTHLSLKKYLSVAMATALVLIIAILLAVAPAAAANEPAPGPNLHASFKSASQTALAPGETLTYTIHLYNTGTVEGTADVADKIPEMLALVPGTISQEGVYHEDTHVITWDKVKVASAQVIELTFDVQIAEGVTIETPTKVTNTAAITTENAIFNRQAQVLLVAEPVPGGDTTAPVVNKVVIGDADLLADPAVILHIDAKDDQAVKWMLIREWQISRGEADKPLPHWKVAKSTGWIPFEAEAAYTLSEGAGVHFIGVWVADESMNSSQIDPDAMDYANLLVPDAPISAPGLVPFLVHYPAGVDVTAKLEPVGGDADLYVWFPHNFKLPDKMSVNPGNVAEEVTFNTPEDGAYIILVHSRTATAYNLTITPAGGPEKGLAVAPAVQANQADTPAFAAEPIFNFSGINPLADVGNPSFTRLFVPLVRR